MGVGLVACDKNSKTYLAVNIKISGCPAVFSTMTNLCCVVAARKHKTGNGHCKECVSGPHSLTQAAQISYWLWLNFIMHLLSVIPCIGMTLTLNLDSKSTSCTCTFPSCKTWLLSYFNSVFFSLPTHDFNLVLFCLHIYLYLHMDITAFCPYLH